MGHKTENIMGTMPDGRLLFKLEVFLVNLGYSTKTAPRLCLQSI